MRNSITPDDFVLNDPEIQKDPYPYYPVLRKQQPVLKSKFGDQPCWVLSRRQEIVKVLMDPKTYSSKTTPMPSMLFSDPPEHARLRNMISHMFSRNVAESMIPWIRTQAEAVLEPLLPAGRCDIIGDFAGPLTIAALGHLLGIPGLQVEQIRKSSHLQADYVLARRLGQMPSPEAQKATDDMTALLINLARSKSFEDGGVLSILSELHFRGELTAEEFVGSSIVLVIAGHSTTTNLIGNAVYTLAQRPRDLDRIENDKAFVTPFLEEVLRTRPSFHRGLRITTQDVELCGELIPAGSLIRMLIGSANRDETIFDQPEDFDPDQKRRMHLAFGQGIHSCLGSWVARMEASTALSVFAERVALVEIDHNDPPVPYSGGTFNEFGFTRLPVLLTARK